MLFSFSIFGFGAFFVNIFLFPCAKLFLKDKKLLYFYSDTIHFTWRFFLKFVMFLRLIKLDIKDKSKIQSIKSKIIVATHPSFIDILILIALIPRTTCIVKSNLSKNIFLNNIINSVFILEDESIEDLKTHSKKMIENGFNIIIFPSGIRHRRNEFPKMRKGASTIAMYVNVDIECLKFYTDYDFLFINQPIYQAGSKPVTYELSYSGNIDISQELEKSENDIVIKRNITNLITKFLYE